MVGRIIKVEVGFRVFVWMLEYIGMIKGVVKRTHCLIVTAKLDGIRSLGVKF